MNTNEILTFLHRAEALKCNTRHSWTSNGRHESVADHSWRLTLMALLARPAFPELDMDRVLAMCVIHDLGEAVTGDIPSFEKTEHDETVEVNAVDALFATLPEPQRGEFIALYRELTERKTPEAKLWKALDNMEAILQHNEASLDTWLPLERELNLVYGCDTAAFAPWTAALRDALKRETEEKLSDEEKTAE